MSSSLSPPLERLRAHLETLLANAPTQDWVRTDPVRFAREIRDPCDREIVAVFAALIAYGRVSAIGTAIEDIKSRMGTSPAKACAEDDEGKAIKRFDGFVYRVTRGVDLARLWTGLGSLLREHGTLLGALKSLDNPEAVDFRALLNGMRSAVVESTVKFADRRGFRHFLPSPYGGSAIKRYNMLMRWMVRGPDTIDMGDWSALGSHRLVLPLDTHTHRIATALGLTQRRQADWRTAHEITSVLKQLCPEDPTKYDFALAHLGISGAIKQEEWKKFVLDARIGDAQC